MLPVNDTSFLCKNDNDEPIKGWYQIVGDEHMAFSIGWDTGKDQQDPKGFKPNFVQH
jgi:hypothetical protein